MFRINSPGATVEGYFTNGNPTTATPATVVDAPWLNMMQDEVENVLVAAGITPSSATNAQLVDAIRILIGGQPGTRNALINGDMMIAQRRKTATISNAAGAVSGFVLDRWLQRADTGAGTGVATASREAFAIGQTAVPGDPVYFLRHQQTTGASLGAPVVEQKIESVRGWSSRSVTFSIWLKSAAPLSVTAQITQNFGTGGSPSGSVTAGSGVFSVTTSWTKFELTVDLGSTSGKTLGTNGNDHLLVELRMATGATFTLDCARAQFEAGIDSTDFDIRPLTYELALCRRYYTKTYELETNPGTATALGAIGYTVWGSPSMPFTQHSLIFNFATEMRAVPAIVWYPTAVADDPGKIQTGSGTISVTGTTAPSRRNSGAPVVATFGAHPIQAHMTADAEL